MRITNYTIIVALVFLTVSAATISCKKGCTDEMASNYSQKAKKDNGTCLLIAEPLPAGLKYNRIMPLGASRVEGDRPNFESFRYELWKDLKENNLVFDFVGMESDPASYPLFNGLDFDTDHEGNSGWTSAEILNGIATSLSQINSPDIILFSSPGGNDALKNYPIDETISNINSIIDVLQSNNPNVKILIEQMAPARSDIMTATLTDYINSLHGEVLIIAANKSTSTSQIIAVDMYTGFTDDFLADDVHYNELGADFLASRYYAVLENILEQNLD